MEEIGRSGRSYGRSCTVNYRLQSEWCVGVTRSVVVVGVPCGEVDVMLDIRDGREREKEKGGVDWCVCESSGVLERRSSTSVDRFFPLLCSP